MDLCLAKKKNGEICNKPTKYIIKIDNNEEYIHPRCGMHSKNIDELNKVKLDEFYQKSNNNVNLNDIANDFNKKLNISDKKDDKDDERKNIINNENKDNKKTEKKEIKKPCLQHILYLISKDKDDMCQYDDCQFAHNIEILYN